MSRLSRLAAAPVVVLPPTWTPTDADVALPNPLPLFRFAAPTG